MRLQRIGVLRGQPRGPPGLNQPWDRKRFRVAVLWSGGFRSSTPLREIDEINFAPRVTTPVLMLNGRDDFTFPIETSHLPMFRLLGTREPDKRHVLYDGGHVFPFARIMKDSLDC